MHYRERLNAPAWYWLVGVLFGASTIIAVGFWYGPWVAFGGGLVVAAVITVAPPDSAARWAAGVAASGAARNAVPHCTATAPAARDPAIEPESEAML